MAQQLVTSSCTSKCSETGTSLFYRYDDEENNGNGAKESWWRAALTTTSISVKYTWADIKQRPRNFCIGVLAVFFVVFFAGIIIEAINKTPYFLLRFAELSMGEMDVVVQADGGSPFMNFTVLQEKLRNSSTVEGIAPRWLARATLASATELRAFMKSSKTSTPQELAPSTTLSIPFDNITSSSSSSSNGKGKDIKPKSLKQVSSNVIIFDSQLEKQVGIGRAWKYREIGYAETQIWYTAAEYVGARPNVGERVVLSLKFEDILQLLNTNLTNMRIYKPRNISSIEDLLLTRFFELNNITDNYTEPVKMVQGQLYLTLADGVEKTDGKYSSVIGNVVLLDYRQLPMLFMDTSCVEGSQLFGPTESARGMSFPSIASLLQLDILMSSIRPLDRVFMTIAILRDRFEMYYGSSAFRDKEMTWKSNGLMYEVGVDYNGSVIYPISEAISKFEMVKIMLTAAFITVVVGIVLLDNILVYNLLQTNAEERQFELAMIRAQGLRKTQLVALLLWQSIAFIIPGVLLGLAFIFIANAIVEMAMLSFTHGIPNPGRISLVTIIVPIILGIVLPLAASWGPITNSLKASLRDALDVYRQTQNEARVVMVKLSELGLEMWQLLLAISLVFIGFIIYYLIPYAFITLNYQLFFVLMDIILVWMLIGLGMMSYVLQPYLSKIFLWFALWRGERKLLSLITKNMKNHSGRNACAYMMFLISVTAVTAAGVAFTALGGVSRELTELLSGADVLVASFTFNNPLDSSALNAFLGEQQEVGIVENWAYASFPLSDYPQLLSSTFVVNAMGTRQRLGVVSVSDSFMNTVYKEYLMVKATDNMFPYPPTWYGGKDIVRSMSKYPAVPVNHAGSELVPVLGTGFSRRSSIPNVSRKLYYTVSGMIASSAEEAIGLSVGSSGGKLRFRYATSTDTPQTEFPINVRAMMNRVSGFVGISSLPLMFSQGVLIVSERDFANLVNPIPADYGEGSNTTLGNNAVTEIRYRSLYIRLRDKLSERQRAAFINGMQGIVDPLAHSSIDTTGVARQLQSVTNLISYFFYFTAFISIVLCTFMMWLTFISNVQLSAWMYGVLRALGFTRAQLTRASVYEALSIVISAFILGIAVGILAALTLVLQINSFLVLPFQFTVPYALILIIFGLALIAAVVGSVLPFRKMNKKSIASILKGA